MYFIKNLKPEVSSKNKKSSFNAQKNLFRNDREEAFLFNLNDLTKQSLG